MANLPVPLDFKPNAPRLRDFTTFSVPNRPLTTGEREVYRTLAKDWAVLDALQQRHLYSLLLEGRLTEFITEIFQATVTTVKTRERAITDTDVRELVAPFNNLMLKMHAQRLAGLSATAGELIAETNASTMPTENAPTRPNLWQRLLKGGSLG